MLGKTRDYLMSTGIQAVCVDGAFTSKGYLHGWRQLSAVTKTGDKVNLPIATQWCSNEGEMEFTLLLQSMCESGAPMLDFSVVLGVCDTAIRFTMLICAHMCRTARPTA